MVHFSNKSFRQPLDGLPSTGAPPLSSGTSTTRKKTETKAGRRSSLGVSRPMTRLEKLNAVVQSLPEEARNDLARQAIAEYNKKRSSSESSLSVSLHSANKTTTSNDSFYHHEDLSKDGNITSMTSLQDEDDEDNVSTTSSLSSISMERSFPRGILKISDSQRKSKRKTMNACQA